MKREPRLEADWRRVGQDELILLFRAAQIFGVQLTAGVKGFSVADYDVLAWCTGCAQPNHSGGVGAYIDDVAVRTNGLHRHRLDRFDNECTASTPAVPCCKIVLGEPSQVNST